MNVSPTYQGLKTFKFGDSVALADRLAALVVAGVKTGTCSAAIHGPDAEIGECQICSNGAGTAVWERETMEMQTRPFEAGRPERGEREGEGEGGDREGGEGEERGGEVEMWKG